MLAQAIERTIRIITIGDEVPAQIRAFIAGLETDLAFAKAKLASATADTQFQWSEAVDDIESDLRILRERLALAAAAGVPGAAGFSALGLGAVGLAAVAVGVWWFFLRKPPRHKSRRADGTRIN